MVMYAPGGIASLIMMNLRVAAHRRLRPLLGWYVVLAAASLFLLAGAAALIELVYHRQLAATAGSAFRFLGVPLDTEVLGHWIAVLAVVAVGAAVFETVRRRFAVRWGATQGAIEADLAYKEPT